jgi:hypothetical protein
MSWFNQVTNTNDFERQSWRDSYNSGRAAGDLTGNVNRRLDAERAAFQGATWSGSSTRYSALELAQRSHGVGAPASGGGSPAAGPGNPVVAQGPVLPGRPAGGSGPGSRFVFDMPLPNYDVLVPDDQPLKRIGVGGQQESMGAISDIGWARTATGWVPVPSSDVKDRLEDNFFMETSWFARNYLGPMFVGGQTPPDFLEPEYSHYIPVLNEWREGGNPRFDKDGKLKFTGGGF